MITLQNVLDQGLWVYKQKHKLPLYKLKALDSLTQCRSSVLGGHVQRCENGHVEGVWYNSCKHRMCPQCNGIQKARWLEAQKARLLNCSHRHIIFTIPHEFHALWRYNTALMIDVLFQAVRDTLMTLCADTQHLGAEPAFLCALHTWGRSLSLHPHIHCLITEGGITTQGGWKTPKRACFLPARVVMHLFRGKFLAALRQAQQEGRLTLPPDLRLNQWHSLLNKLGRKKWNVNVREQYPHGHGVATYLARYMRGGPLNNRQLRHLNSKQVSFRYYAHQDNPEGQKKHATDLTLSLDDFITRYLTHVPPKGKAMFRAYGAYSNGKRSQLNALREHFQQAPVATPKFMTWETYYEQLNGKAPPICCSQCGAPLKAPFKVEPERLSAWKPPNVKPEYQHFVIRNH